MHTAITVLFILAVSAVVILPLPLTGYAIQRRRRRRAENPATYAFQPALSSEPDELPPHLLAAWRVEGFLSEAERLDHEAAVATRTDLDRIQSETLLRVRGAVDSAVAKLVGGRDWVELGKPHDQP